MLLKNSDTIQLQQSNETINNSVEESVANAWKGGIQKKSDKTGCFELKLKGHPFYSQHDGMMTYDQLLVLIIAFRQQVFEAHP